MSKGIQYPDGYDDSFADAVVQVRGEARKKRTTFVRLWVVSSLISLVSFSLNVWRSSTCNGLDIVELSTIHVWGDGRLTSFVVIQNLHRWWWAWVSPCGQRWPSVRCPSSVTGSSAEWMDSKRRCLELSVKKTRERSRCSVQWFENMVTMTLTVISSSVSVGVFNPRGVLTSTSRSMERSPAPQPI